MSPVYSLLNPFDSMRKANLSLPVLAGALLAAFALPAQASSEALDAAWKQLPAIHYGEDYSVLQPIDSAVKAAENNPGLQRRLEPKFIEVLQNSQATNAAKDYSCRALRLIGTPSAVPALALLLGDPELAGLARYALEEIPGREVNAALRSYLPRLEGDLKIGIISSLDRRRDRRAVAPLETELRNDDERIAVAAALALGGIGSQQAAQALMEFRPEAAADLRHTVNVALVEAADHLLQQGRRRLANNLFNSIAEDKPANYLQLAAFRGRVSSSAPRTAHALLLQALAGEDAQRRNLASRLVVELPADSTPAVFLQRLPELPTPGQVALLRAFKHRGDPTTRQVVIDQCSNPKPEVRSAALTAMAELGTGRDVALLARWAAEGAASDREAARTSLIQLDGDHINESIVAALSEVNADEQVELLNALSNRVALESAPAITPQLDSPHPKVRQAAANTIGNLGDENQVPVLTRHLLAAETPNEQTALAAALGEICGRVHQKAADSLLNALQSAEMDSTRILLIQLLGNLGNPPALAAARAAANDPNQAIVDAAVREIADWPNPNALPDLRKILNSSENLLHRILAFRGYVRLLRQNDATSEEKVARLTEAMNWAPRQEDKKLVLAALGDIPSLIALDASSQQLDQPELATEAGAAIVKIATQLDPKFRDSTLPALRSVIENVSANAVVEDARKQIRRLEDR